MVIGAGRGLGRAVAIAGGRAGARVVIAARTQAEVDRVAGELRTLGVEAIAVAADARRPADVARVFDASAGWGTPGLIVNCVGDWLVKPFEDCTFDDYHRIVENNLTPAFVIGQAAMPRLIARGGGRLVFVSSRVAVTGGAPAALYGAAKAGVVNLARSLAQLGKPHGCQRACDLPRPDGHADAVGGDAGLRSRQGDPGRGGGRHDHRARGISLGDA